MLHSGLGGALCILLASTVMAVEPKDRHVVVICIDGLPAYLFDDSNASMPTIRGLAAKGALGKPEVLRAQAERLLSSPQSRTFVDAFLDYWLDLRKLNETTPGTAILGGRARSVVFLRRSR